MSSPKHTPGPWEACDVGIPMGPLTGVRIAGRGDRAALICTTRWQGDATQANTQLVAAAPDLLEALVALMDNVDDGGFYARPAVIESARAAIAKARGEAGA